MSWAGIELVQVVAVDQNFCIGKNNTLPWHVSDDLKHFKQITQGGVLVMGRKNYDSIGRPLPGRLNLVVTRQPQWQADGTIAVREMEAALDLAAAEAKDRQQKQIFIIGGAEIFTHTLPFTDQIELTRLELLTDDGDVFYPAIPANFYLDKSRRHQDEKSGVHMSFETYRRSG